MRIKQSMVETNSSVMTFPKLFTYKIESFGAQNATFGLAKDQVKD